MRAILYARVSSRQQVDNTSLDNQIDQMREYCAQRGYEIVEEIREQFSGAYSDRPGINRMKQLGMSGQADVVVVYRLDRFMRGDDAESDPGIDAALTERELNRHGLEVIYLDLPDKDGEGYVYVKTIKRLVASIERRNINTRMAEGRRKRVEQGAPLNIVPYGYIKVMTTEGDCRVDVVEEQAEAVRNIYSWAIQGLTAEVIAERLNAAGFPSPGDLKGNAKQRVGWDGTHIYNILRQEGYTGNYPQYKNRHVTTYIRGHRKVKTTPRPREEWLWIEIPAIITKETYDLAQDRKRKNRPQKRKHPKLFPPGSISCARCGYSISHRRVSTDYYYYRCSRQYKNRIGDCDLPTFDGHALEEAVWSFVYKLITNEDFLIEKYQEIRKMRQQVFIPLSEQLSATNARIAEHSRELQNILKILIQATDIETEILKPERERLNNLLVSLIHRRTQIEKDIAASDVNEDEIEAVLKFVGRVRKGFERLQADPQFRDKVMRLFQVEVKLDADRETGDQIVYVSCQLGIGEVSGDNRNIEDIFDTMIDVKRTGYRISGALILR